MKNVYTVGRDDGLNKFYFYQIKNTELRIFRS